MYETVDELHRLRARLLATGDGQPERHLVCCGIERVAYQRALREAVQYDRRGKKVHVQIAELRPDTDKIRRARSVSHLCEQGRVHIRSGPDEMFTQITTFPQVEHDDMADAFVYLLKTMQRFYQFGYPIEPPPAPGPKRDKWVRVGAPPKKAGQNFAGLW